MIKVLFAGTPEVAVPSLLELAHNDAFEVVAVLTRPDAPSGRGRKLMPSPVKQAALELGLPVIESDPRKETFIHEIADTGAQVAAVVAYGKILRQPVLDALPMGWVNLHFSLLPQYRGAAPVQRALWSGETVTGVSVFRIDAGLDSGPILAQSTTDIQEHETSGELLTRLAHDGARLLSASLVGLAQGEIIPVEQPLGSYPTADKITTEDAHIRFDVPAFAIDRQIRACTPHPGAWCYLAVDVNDIDEANGKPKSSVLHMLKAQVADSTDSATPVDLPAGRLAVTKKHVWVGSVSGPLELLEVKAQGKKAMRAADWARGARLQETSYCW